MHLPVKAEDAAVLCIDALEALAIPYMVVGSLTTNYYGVPRSTQGADFVVELGELSISQIAARLGDTFKLDSQMSFETVTGTVRHRMRLIEHPLTVEFFLLGNGEHDKSRFQRRVRTHMLGRQTWVSTAEDVIITKLRWSKHARRTKDADDVRDVLAVQGDNLDLPYLHEWCARHDTRQLLDHIRTQLPS